MKGELCLYCTGVYNDALVTSLHTALSVKKLMLLCPLIELCQLHSLLHINQLKISTTFQKLWDTYQ